MNLVMDASRSLRAGALGVAIACLAGGASAESLSDALAIAYRNSPELASARANVKIQSERAVQARARGRVTVRGDLSLEAGVSENIERTDFFGGGGGGGFDDLFGTGDDDQYELEFPSTLALSFTQPLYTGGQVANATEAAETRITEERAILLAVEQELLLGTVTAYMDVRRDDELVIVAENNIRVLSEQLRAAEERFEVGEVTRTDVEQARARLAAARSRLAAERGALAISREAYAQVVGQVPGDLAPPPPLPELPGNPSEATAIALQDEPRVIAARLERAATGSDVRAAMGALLPQLSLQGSLQSLDDDFGGQGRLEDAAVGLFLTIPFYTGGENYSRVREAQAFAERASAEITTQMRTAAERVGVAWANLEVARASIKAGVLEVQAAELAFEGVTEEAKVGARTTIDVLDAEQEVLDARADLIRAQRNEYVAAYNLLSAIGKLTVDHLGLDVGETEAVAGYYASVKDRNFGYDKTDDTVWRFDLRP